MASGLMQSMGKQILEDKKHSMKNRMAGKKGPEVDWSDFNFPKFIDVVHLDSEDMSDTSAFSQVDKLAIYAYYGIAGVMVLNLVDNCILTIWTGIWVNILYSIFNFTLFVPLATYMVYKLHKAMVQEKLGDIRKFNFLSGVQIIFCLGFCLVSFVGINGLFAFSRLSNFESTGGKIFSSIAIVLETSIWLTISVTSTLNTFNISNILKSGQI